MRRNNKGFSLIELIIVIAIMAILVAIIAPNLTKYLSKSKKNADMMNADEIKKIYEQALALTNVEVAEPHNSVISTPTHEVWNEISEGEDVYDSTAPDEAGYMAFSKYISTVLDEVPKSKTTGGYFKVKITKDSDGRYHVEVDY